MNNSRTEVFQHLPCALSTLLVRDTSKLSYSMVTCFQICNEEMRDLLAANKGWKRERLELEEDPNKGVLLLGETRSTSSAIQGIRSNLFVRYSQKTTPEITDDVPWPGRTFHHTFCLRKRTPSGLKQING